MAQAGEDVTFIDSWPENVETMRAKGLRISHIRDVPEFTAKVRALHVTDAAAARQGEADRHRLRLHEILRHRLGDDDDRQYLAPNGFVVSLQNCMNEETIAGVVGWGRTWAASPARSPSICASRAMSAAPPARAATRHTVFRAGEVHGRITDRLKEICRLVAYADSAHGHRRISGASAGRSW